jgi:hypothetical protein
MHATRTMQKYDTTIHHKHFLIYIVYTIKQNAEEIENNLFHALPSTLA